MVSIRFLSTTLLLGQALAQPWNALNPGDTVLRSSLSPLVTQLNSNMKRQAPTSTTSSLETVFSTVTTTSYSFTVTSTTTVTGGTTTPSTTTTSTTSSSSTSSSCPTPTYIIQASGTGDSAIDNNFARLSPAFGGYTVPFDASQGSAQKFHLGGPTCDTLFTADNSLQAMIGDTAALHTVFFFPSTAAAAALVNVNWESLVCVMNADNTLSCTGMQQSIFQTLQNDKKLYIGDQNYGRTVTLNLVPVPGTVF